ncbi:hypothetical protein OSTOST_04616 [Ostertagia ostertagi]
MDKITDIQLKFDTAPFPAITLCNLNPYKDSTIRDEESVKKILEVFAKIMKKAGTSGDSLQELEEVVETARTVLPLDGSRKRRDKESKGSFEPVPTESDGMCICAFDRLTQDAWPCHPKAYWQEHHVPMFCGTIDMFCQKYSKNGERQNEPCSAEMARHSA